MKKNVLLIIFLSLFAPIISFAADIKTLNDLFKYLSELINTAIIPLIFTAAFALFVYGVLQYMLNPTEETKRTKGKQFMIWGIIALTVMFSVFGIIKIFGDSFGILDKDVSIPEVSL